MVTSKTSVEYSPASARGDQRRTAMLAALDGLLAEKSLADIEISDITRVAGVTRSGFYFYFKSKAEAVAALLADFYDQMYAAADVWYGGGDGPADVRMREGFGSVFRLWRGHATLLVGMLDAIGTDTQVRKVWNSWIEQLTDRITDRIADDLGAGLTRADLEPRPLATVLLGAALQVMEREVRGIAAGHEPSDELFSTLVKIWAESIYRV